MASEGGRVAENVANEGGSAAGNVASEGGSAAGNVANEGVDGRSLLGNVANEIKKSFFKKVDLKCMANNIEHHTNEISLNRLMLRRGQPFKLDLDLSEPFNPVLNPLHFCATTGAKPSEEQGTSSFFSIPDKSAHRSPSAKAVWKVECHSTITLTSSVALTITPPADAPVGKYKLLGKYKDEEEEVAELVLLFNPWCSDDTVFMPNEAERREYVLNEQGTIYRGTSYYPFPLAWNFGQFEEDMVDICLKLMDLNPKHLSNPADDVASRCDPIYVSRVISAMVNSEGDYGVLQGNWSGYYSGGLSPTHWSGSVDILQRWFNSDCRPVKYGQCWVFAGVMCTVMRFFGIPCRVITNFDSAHDTDGNLIIDTFYDEDGAMLGHKTDDSVWNFHVWTEGLMKRPDLGADGKYDGWQVVDPTPQELSEGAYCCGPASVNAILKGHVDLKYDGRFVFAEVNADCVDWEVLPDGSKRKLDSDPAAVGWNISTKAVGSDERLNITNTYKHKEGSEKERDTFRHAIGRTGETDDTGDTNEVDQKIVMRFEEVTKPVNGKDVSLKVVLSSKALVSRFLSVKISVQAMRYNGTAASKIQTEKKEETLLPGKELSIPILVPFSDYTSHMLMCESMKISVMVKDKQNEGHPYMAHDEVALEDPPISVIALGAARVYNFVKVQIVFVNPINETLKNCTLSLSGSGLLRHEVDHNLPDLPPNRRVRINCHLLPYKPGEKTLMVDIDCSYFRDVKGSCVINIAP